jgi:hypothetical protein
VLVAWYRMAYFVCETANALLTLAVEASSLELVRYLVNATNLVSLLAAW